MTDQEIKALIKANDNKWFILGTILASAIVPFLISVLVLYGDLHRTNANFILGIERLELDRHTKGQEIDIKESAEQRAIDATKAL